MPQRELYAQSARVVDELLNPGLSGKDRTLGFTILVYPFGTAGESHYVSNGADKQEMAALLREAAQRLDERTDLERGVGGMLQ